MHTRKLLEFITAQKLDLSEYQTLVPLLKEKFDIKLIGGGVQDYTKQLVDTVIQWEDSTTDDALEKILNSKYLIYLRK